MNNAGGPVDRVRYAPRWQRLLIMVASTFVAIFLSTNLDQRNPGLIAVLAIAIALAANMVDFIVILVSSYIQDALDRRHGL